MGVTPSRFLKAWARVSSVGSAAARGRGISTAGRGQRPGASHDPRLPRDALEGAGRAVRAGGAARTRDGIGQAGYHRRGRHQGQGQRQDRLAAIAQARERLEKRQREADLERGRDEDDDPRPRGKDGKPKARGQENFTDGDSRIMKRAGGVRSAQPAKDVRLAALLRGQERPPLVFRGPGWGWLMQRNKGGACRKRQSGGHSRNEPPPSRFGARRYLLPPTPLAPKKV